MVFLIILLAAIAVVFIVSDGLRTTIASLLKPNKKSTSLPKYESSNSSTKKNVITKCPKNNPLGKPRHK